MENYRYGVIYFGAPGSLNDLNILDRSPTIESIIAGQFPTEVSFTVSGEEYGFTYYLADGIYPNWALFVKNISERATSKGSPSVGAQETVKKDVEHAFGVFVAQLCILALLSRFWYNEDISNMIKVCVILHNMVEEAWRHNY